MSNLALYEVGGASAPRNIAPFRLADATTDGTTSRIGELFQAGAGIREAAASLGLSRNKVAFLALKGGIAPVAKPADSTGARPNFDHTPPLPATSAAVAKLSEEQVAVLTDLIVRQGCSAATAARALAIATNRSIPVPELIATCAYYSIKPIETRANMHLTDTACRPPEPQISDAPQQSLSSAPLDTQRLGPAGNAAAPAAGRQRAARSPSILELGHKHCRTIVGHNEKALALFCGEVKKPGSSYCPACHARYFVKPPPGKPTAKRERPKFVAAPTGADIYRKIAEKMRSECRI